MWKRLNECLANYWRQKNNQNVKRYVWLLGSEQRTEKTLIMLWERA